jgi:hypothetical protein
MLFYSRNALTGSIRVLAIYREARIPPGYVGVFGTNPLELAVG